MKIKLSEHFTYHKLLRFVFPSIVMMIFTSIYGVVVLRSTPVRAGQRFPEPLAPFSLIELRSSRGAETTSTSC